MRAADQPAVLPPSTVTIWPVMVLILALWVLALWPDLPLGHECPNISVTGRDGPIHQAAVRQTS